jgi:hypothetical protein
MPILVEVLNACLKLILLSFFFSHIFFNPILELGIVRDLCFYLDTFVLLKEQIIRFVVREVFTKFAAFYTHFL